MSVCLMVAPSAHLPVPDDGVLATILPDADVRVGRNVVGVVTCEEVGSGWVSRIVRGARGSWGVPGSAKVWARAGNGQGSVGLMAWVGRTDERDGTLTKAKDAGSTDDDDDRVGAAVFWVEEEDERR